jgi:hypothetical protein
MFQKGQWGRQTADQSGCPITAVQRSKNSNFRHTQSFGLCSTNLASNLQLTGATSYLFGSLIQNSRLGCKRAYDGVTEWKAYQALPLQQFREGRTQNFDTNDAPARSLHVHTWPPTWPAA